MNEELIIGPLDRHFAQLMVELNGAPSEELKFAAETVSAHRSKGDICISIGDPATAQKLRATRVVGAPGENKPLILDAHDRLYLQRYWAYEQRLASAIRARLTAPLEGAAPSMLPLEGTAPSVPGLEGIAPSMLEPKAPLKHGIDRAMPSNPPPPGTKPTPSVNPLPGVNPPPPGITPAPPIDSALLNRGLDDFFQKNPGAEWQRRAAETAARKNFCVITGGPGTGKTRTVLIVLMLLHAQFAAHGKTPRIALAAPTGKAAARMKESMEATLASLPQAQAFTEHLPSDATTIHRLLGVIPDSPYFRHNAEHPLANDVVIVDEASMVDLALMAKLVDAVPPTARLILLGDKDQLASVEAGSVLGDICQAADDTRAAVNGSNLHEHIVELKTNFRFGNESAIYKLSRCVTEGRSADALALLKVANSEEIGAHPLPSPSSLPAALFKTVLDGFRSYRETSDPREALAQFNRFRILCAVRVGPYGVESINALVERIMAAEGLIDPSSRHYAGRPILILKNDYQLKLYNGDTGLVLPDPEAGGALRAFFLTTEGSLRRLIPTRLPPHETVFAMTVHKSQGSEFGRVLFILPDHESPILTRELIYTGLTRARNGLELWHRDAILRTAIDTPTQRVSGLHDALIQPA